MSEICLLDRDPLLPLLSAPASSPAAADGQAPVARLRYQQTKIDGAPDTVLADAGVVAIIREQQEWADRFFAGRGAPGKTPKYLFLAGQMNRNGDRPYSGGTLHARLSELAPASTCGTPRAPWSTSTGPTGSGTQSRQAC